MDQSSFLVFAINTAKTAGKILLNHFGKISSFKQKSTDIDLVTVADTESESFIIKEIQSTYPTHQIITEESDMKIGTSDYKWVIDPLDGTTNFVHGLAPFCVSIALMEDNEPILGVVSELPAGNLFWAERNEGAYCNGDPIHVATTRSVTDALLITGFAYEHDFRWVTNMKLFKDFTNISQGVRRLGSAAADLCYVACGKADGFWEIGLQPWDSAAGVLLIMEAGGKVSRMDGKPFTIHDQHLLATNGYLHKEMLGKTVQAIASIFDKD